MRFLASSLIAGSLVVNAAQAADPCDSYAWDVSRERALFGKEPIELVTGHARADAPVVQLDRPYSLGLAALAGIEFPIAPARKPAADAGLAGMAMVHSPNAMRVRVSVDAAVWIDVVAGGALLPTHAFQGAHGCTAPRKIVEFDLPAGDSVVEFSGAVDAHLRFALTGEPGTPL